MKASEMLVSAYGVGQKHSKGMSSVFKALSFKRIILYLSGEWKELVKDLREKGMRKERNKWVT